MVMISTKFFPRPISEPTQKAFLRSAFSFYFPRYLYTKAMPKKSRHPETVKHNYDMQRGQVLRDFPSAKPDLTTYVFGNAEERDFGLLEDRVVYGPIPEPRKQVMEMIEFHLAPYLRENRGRIVEFGSGDGKNLLWLKSRYPKIEFIGLELSPVSVALSQAASDHFRLDVQFLEANVCAQSLPALPADVSVCFSCHALEQMPRIYPVALENMLRLAGFEVFLFEPVVELSSKDFRGVLSRWRAACLDRLSGLKPFVERRGWDMVAVQRLRNADNPLNETCLVRIRRPKVSSLE